MDERSGGAGKSEEVLAWTGVSWTGGKVATEEVSTWTGVSWTGGKVATDEGTVVVVEVIEGKVVEETGIVVVVGEMVFIFVEFSLLALGRDGVFVGFRFLFGSGGGTTAVGWSRCGSVLGDFLCS